MVVFLPCTLRHVNEHSFVTSKTCTSQLAAKFQPFACVPEITSLLSSLLLSAGSGSSVGEVNWQNCVGRKLALRLPTECQRCYLLAFKNTAFRQIIKNIRNA